MQKQHHRTPYLMKEPASQTNSEAKFLGPARSLGNEWELISKSFRNLLKKGYTIKVKVGV